MVSATTLVVSMTLAVTATLASAAARGARAGNNSRAVAAAVIPEPQREGGRAADDTAPHSCAQPSCRDLHPDAAHGGDAAFTPVDIRVHLGEVAVASMEGLWLRRGPTLRNEPIMVSPVVVGDAVTLALGGRF